MYLSILFPVPLPSKTMTKVCLRPRKQKKKLPKQVKKKQVFIVFSFCILVLKEFTQVFLCLQHSVFNRLGQKCDVSSTSIETAVIEERKSVINIEFVDTANKPNTVLTKSMLSSISIVTFYAIFLLTQYFLRSGKVSINRKVKIEDEDEDASSCVPSCVKSTYSEGILGISTILSSLFHILCEQCYARKGYVHFFLMEFF